jgi:hypothetical protein
MGAWGTSLYANDSASDIRGDYVDKLRRGKPNEEVTQELIDSNQEIMGEVEEEPLFWFALADTQWNYGRLLPDVKEKALYFLSQNVELGRWKESGEKQANEWKNTLCKLREKLLTSPPPEKKISTYRLFRCKWQLGDVFAYQFSSEYSKETGTIGQYITFRKISEDVNWPGHIVPAVHVYQWIGSSIPSLDEIKNMSLLPQKFLPSVYINNPNKEKEYLFDLLVASEKAIPKGNLTFLGNVQGNDLFPYLGFNYPNQNYFTGYARAEWKDFEKKILDQYFAWTA